MKTIVASSLCIALLAGCVATPPTPLSEHELGASIYWRNVAQYCTKKGHITYLPAVTNYIAQTDQKVRARADAARISAAEQKINKDLNSSGISREWCREVEAAAVQQAQQQSDQQRQEDISRQEEAVDDLVRAQNTASLAAAQQNAFNSRPVTCTHYQWGNTTFCN